MNYYSPFDKMLHYDFEIKAYFSREIQDICYRPKYDLYVENGRMTE